ncbi:MAG: hypothetical protein EBR30_25925 [Cytophagia bacterium]|nr:hypothetical protein [Cytophagia bacterium]
MTDYTFHPEYVEPYYGLLMNANFVGQPDSTPRLFNGLKKIEKELDTFQLVSMLRSSWRPSKVAAWTIGFCQRVALEHELINTLRNTPFNSEHLIFGLAFLNTESSISSIESYVELETDSLKENFQLDRIDWLSFDWAIAALTWLDKTNNTNRIEKTLHVWDIFKKDIKIYEEKYQFKIDEWIRFKEKIRLFDEAMWLAKSYL